MTGGTLALAMTKTYGGAEESLRVLLARLAASPRRRRIWLIHDHPQMASCPADRRVRVPFTVEGVSATFAMPSRALGMIAICARMRPTVALANGFRSTLVLAALAGFMLAAARVVYVHDASRRGLDLLLRFLRPHLVLVPSAAIASRYAGRYRTIVIQAFDPPTVAGPPRTRTPRTPLRLTLVANLVRLKGVEHAIAAVARLGQQGIEATLSVFGGVVDPAYADEIAALARASDGRVRLAGYRPIEEVYADCDVALVTTVSRHGGPETFGRSILDAYERGIPVVAFDCGGPTSLVVDGRTGALVPEGDDEALAAALARLALDGHLYARCSAGARRERDRLQRRLDAPVDRLVRSRLFSAGPRRSSP